MRALIDYLGGLQLAGGDHDGDPFTVLGWQRRFLSGAFRGIGDAGLSVARGNGKSALVAAVACAVVDPAGPLTGTRREVVVVAASFDQSRIIFEDVLAFLGARYDLSDRAEWRRQGLREPGDSGVPGERGAGALLGRQSGHYARHPAGAFVV